MMISCSSSHRITSSQTTHHLLLGLDSKMAVEQAQDKVNLDLQVAASNLRNYKEYPSNRLTHLRDPR